MASGCLEKNTEHTWGYGTGGNVTVLADSTGQLFQVYNGILVCSCYYFSVGVFLHYETVVFSIAKLQSKAKRQMWCSCQNFLKDRTKHGAFHQILWSCVKEFSGCVQHSTIKSLLFHEMNQHCKSQKNWESSYAFQNSFENNIWTLKKIVATYYKTKWTFIFNV